MLPIGGKLGLMQGGHIDVAETWIPHESIPFSCQHLVLYYILITFIYQSVELKMKNIVINCVCKLYVANWWQFGVNTTCP